jgi:hypothetical protein
MAGFVMLIVSPVWVQMIGRTISRIKERLAGIKNKIKENRCSDGGFDLISLRDRKSPIADPPAFSLEPDPEYSSIPGVIFYNRSDE